MRPLLQDLNTCLMNSTREILCLKITLKHNSLSGCARFPQFVQNFSERQLLWSLCSVDFHTFTSQLPIQTLHSVAPELPVFVSSLKNCQNFSKMSTPL